LIYFKMITFWPFERIKRFTLQFFSGMLLPINFMPLALQNVLKYLPFNYFFYEPSRIYLNIYPYGKVLEIIGIQILWIILLYLFFNYFFKKAVKKFEGVGS